MLGYISIALLSVSVYWILRTIANLHHNIAIAKTTGFSYYVTPVDVSWIWYAAAEPLVVGFLQAVPYMKDSRLVMLCTTHRSWMYKQRSWNELGEVYLVVSPWSTFLNVSNPHGIVQLMTRRQGFAKPLEFYAKVDIFGSSILTTEGPTWKRHRKIVGPAFAEKSNLLVWEETIRQTGGMLNSWSERSGNTKDSMTVHDGDVDVAHLALHVISGAGFGVTQLWEGDSEDQLGENIIPGFNTRKLTKGHILTFKSALQQLISGIIWRMLAPDWFLKYSPWPYPRSVLRAYAECANYFNELREYKADLLDNDKTDDERTMDIMAPLVRASQKTAEDPNGLYLTEQEVRADAWIFLFAGHETTANTLLYTITFLAIVLRTQSQLHEELDAVLGTRPRDEWTYEKDMGFLYNSLLGASYMETLRLMPPVLELAKVCRGSGPQMIEINGKDYLIPIGTYLQMDVSAVHRVPKYWPHSPSMISSADHDMDDFVPQRWRSSIPTTADISLTKEDSEVENIDGLEKVSIESKAHDALFVPIPGSYIPFSDGPRSCPGKRFAQVELTAALAVIFHEFTVELDVSKWASDAEVESMSLTERRVVYEKAIAVARKAINESTVIIALKMTERIPLRIVKRGKERFMDCYV